MSCRWALVRLETSAPFTSFSFELQWSDSSILDIPHVPSAMTAQVLDVPAEEFLLTVTRSSRPIRSTTWKQWDNQLCGSHCLNIYCNSVSKKCFTKIHYCLHRTAVKIRVEHAREEEKVCKFIWKDFNHTVILNRSHIIQGMPFTSYHLYLQL